MEIHHSAAKAAFCLVGCLHLITFASLLVQSPLLFGRNGLQPISAFLEASAQQLLPPGSSYGQRPSAMLQSNPTLLWFHLQLGVTAETMFAALCFAGMTAAFAAACGVMHPLIFGTLWALYLSAVGVGQAFLPQPGDAVLLELTFACIWLSTSILCSSQQKQQVQQHNDEVDQQEQQQPTSKQVQQTACQPASLLLRWLLFKLLLLSSSTKAFVACSGASGLAECYRVLAAQGQPHSLTWLSQALPSPLAAALGALAMLELPAAFLVLCTAPVMQLPVTMLLVLQLARAVLGSNTLLHLAAAALCVACLGDSVVASALQRARKGLQHCLGTSDEANADQQRPLGRHQRTGSNDSLASLVSLEDLQLPPESGVTASIWSSRTLQVLAGVAVLIAVLVLGNSGKAGRVFWLTKCQMTALLQLLVPAAAAAWFVVWARAAWQSFNEARSAALAAVDELQRRAKAAAEAAAQAKASAGVPAAGSAAKPAVANGVAAAADLSLPAPPRAIAVARAAADAETPSGTVGHTGSAATAAAAAAKEDDEEGTPKAAATGRRRAAAKAAAPSGTPRKGRASSKSASGLAAAAGTDGDTDAEHQEDAAPESAAPAAGRKRGTAARRRKMATAAAAEDAAANGDGTAAAETPAAAAAAAAAGPSATPAAAAKTPVAAAATPAAGKAPVQGIAGAGLLELLAPHVGVVGTAAVAAVVLFVFVAGLPAVLAPVGYSQTSLRSSVPGLLNVYRGGRAYGIVSSSSTTQLAWQATAAAAQQLPGSYLAFQLSTSLDGQAWQPVRFSHGVPAAGLGSLRGVYEPRLQGRLAAAGSGSLEDNMWLLSLADRLLEGSAVLGPVLAQPLQQHNWVKIDLVRCSPSSLPEHKQQLNGDSSGWLVQHVAEVLPVMPRGDQDLKDTLVELGWETQAAAPRSLAVSLSAPWLLFVLLVLVALRHCLLSGGLVHGAAAEQDVLHIH